MGEPPSAGARLKGLLAGVALLALATRLHADVGVAPIVGGALTSDFPAVGALLAGNDPTTAETSCSGVLVGCRTFVTAAHCLCTGTGASCQGANAPSPDSAIVFFDHAGFVPIESIAIHPAFVFPVADVAVVRLVVPVTGVAPAAVNDVGPPPFGTTGSIVGFGARSGAANDTGLKRVGTVTTAPCVAGVSDATSVCWDFTGTGANTCEGDSGGPLFVDLGGGPVVAGVTTGGVSASCLPTDHSYDASLFAYRDWIDGAAGGDVGTSGCGELPPAGAAGTVVTAFSGELDAVRPFALHSIGVAAGTSELRVAMHGTEALGVDFDLYVRGGAAPAIGTFDCRAVGGNQWGFCRIPDPAPGSWFVRAERVRGDGLFQLVVTTFGGVASVCGNAVREPGEDCDGGDLGTCTTGCKPDCSCVECAASDLTVREIVLAPRLFVQATLGDDIGSYTAIDPQHGGVTFEFTDGTNAATIAVPPDDPGWVVANGRRGVYRWRGARGAPVRRIVFRTRRKHPTEWSVQLRGKHVPGAAAVTYGKLVARVIIGNRCAERRFHPEQTPRLPRAGG